MIFKIGVGRSNSVLERLVLDTSERPAEYPQSVISRRVLLL